MILERHTPLQLNELEAAIRRAVRRRRATVASVDKAGAATVFNILQPDLYAQLLAADARFSAFLPCRIAAFADKSTYRLVSLSPVAFARELGREVVAAAAGAETLLTEILEEIARPVTMTAGHAESGWGATEDQMNMRGTVPPRIDRRGSKVEELAGTGEQDSRGG